MTAARDVIYSPEAEAQIVALYEYLATNASPAIAAEYTDAIVGRCEQLGEMPFAGVPRDDIRRGMRLTFFRKRSPSPTPSPRRLSPS